MYLICILQALDTAQMPPPTHTHTLCIEKLSRVCIIHGEIAPIDLEANIFSLNIILSCEYLVDHGRGIEA